MINQNTVKSHFLYFDYIMRKQNFSLNESFQTIYVECFIQIWIDIGPSKSIIRILSSRDGNDSAFELIIVVFYIYIDF